MGILAQKTTRRQPKGFGESPASNPIASPASVSSYVYRPITRFDLDPTIFNGLVQPSLEIGISHIDEMIASKYAARTNFMLHENLQDLAPYFFIRYHVARPLEPTITQVGHHRKRRNGIYILRLARRRGYRMSCRDLIL
jgi:hypothetical protein